MDAFLGDFALFPGGKRLRSPGAILGWDDLTSTHFTIGICQGLGIYCFRGHLSNTISCLELHVFYFAELALCGTGFYG